MRTRIVAIQSGVRAVNRPHLFVLKICQWLYCAKCGLVLLKNDATKRAASQPCPGSE